MLEILCVEYDVRYFETITNCWCSDLAAISWIFIFAA